MSIEKTAPVTRCGAVAILGAPNAGKSTLVNQLVGTKVTIVSHKVQTTRNRILGIFTHETPNANSQIVLWDTPGLFKPSTRLERAMVKAAWGGAEEAEIVILIYDAQKKTLLENELHILENLKQRNIKHLWLALNKIDAVKREDLLALTASLNEQLPFQKTFMISALKGDGLEVLKNEMAENLPENPFYYEADQVSDLPMRLLAAEVTREKIFHYLHQELPYAMAVETEEWEEFENGSVRLRQVIYVERDSQKGIVLGKRGEMLKRIGSETRHELKEILERDVHLKIFVKVSSRWRDDPHYYATWGLDGNA